MGLDIIEFRESLRAHVGMDEDDLPDPIADLVLNMSYWEILDKFHFREKEVTVTFSTVAGVRTYNMPSPFEALRQLSIIDSEVDDNLHHKLKRITPAEYEDKYDEDSEEYGLPVEYVREGCGVKLWPTPNAVHTVIQKYWTVLSDLSVSNDTPQIPQSWHEIILYGAVWRAFLRIGDYPRGNAAKQHQVSLINSAVPVEAKEEYDSREAGLSVKMRTYDV